MTASPDSQLIEFLQDRLKNFLSELKSRVQSKLDEWISKTVLQGIARKLVEPKGSGFVLSSDSGKPYHFFGFNREYIVQLASYIRLIELGYPRDQVLFEHGRADVVVLQEKAKVNKEEKWLIQVEVKMPSELKFKDENKHFTTLIQGIKLEKEHREGRVISRRIVKHHPEYLWIVYPNRREYFKVTYTSETAYKIETVGDEPPPVC